MAASPAVASQRALTTADANQIADAVLAMDLHMERARQVSPELAKIREQQRTFLRGNQKFPDFIDVGIRVWEDVVDWHVRHGQPLNLSRAVDGRYLMLVHVTTLVLRSDQADAYEIGRAHV